MYFYYNDLLYMPVDRSLTDWWKDKTGRLRDYLYVSIRYTNVLGEQRTEQYITDASGWVLRAPRVVDKPPAIENGEIDLSEFAPKSDETDEDRVRRGRDAAITFKNAIDALDK
jgi:hypothetical protein